MGQKYSETSKFPYIIHIKLQLFQKNYPEVIQFIIFLIKEAIRMSIVIP